MKPPNLEAFQKFGMEPEMLAWDAFNMTEIKLAASMEEAVRMLKQAK